ncbi:putative pectate lyase [Helianthus annuus]|nr:putative pectate lyase [Helianthus annuus]
MVGGGGGCMATNPIDRCWRCHKDWAQNRQALGECARGFGERTTGVWMVISTWSRIALTTT